MIERRAIVVGGGLAGVSAAVVLAERGVRVEIIESESFLGGRVGAWKQTLDSGASFEMERGFHAFFRHYYNLRSLLRRIDPALSFLTKLEDYPLLGPNGAAESFSHLPKMTPFNMFEVVRRSRSMRIRDLANVRVRSLLDFLAFDPMATYDKLDDVSAKEYLDSLQFPPEARRMLFEVFAHSFFNSEEEMSAAELVAMFHFYFTGNPEGLVFDVLNQPFSTGIWEPMTEYLRKLGVQISFGKRVHAIEKVGASYSVDVDGEIKTADACVLAVSVPALKSIYAKSPTLSHPQLDRSIGSLDVTLPFAVWRLWLDRPTRSDRTAFVGTAGLGALDNISLFHLFENESKEWAERTNGSVVELHAYGVGAHHDENSCKKELISALYELYPETRGATIVDEVWLWKQDCPSYARGAHAARPTVSTPFSRLQLAGDFVKLPMPSALMEKATTSGMMAANEILQTFGLFAEPIRSIPTHGICAPEKFRQTLRKPWEFANFL